jgi:hypothetical protein
MRTINKKKNRTNQKEDGVMTRPTSAAPTSHPKSGDVFTNPLSANILVQAALDDPQQGQ